MGVSAASMLSVVDDDTSVRETLMSLFTSVGYKVFERPQISHLTPKSMLSKMTRLGIVRQAR